MKQSYDTFCNQINTANFEGVNQTLIGLGYTSLKPQNFQLEIKLKDQKLKDTPWIKNKEPFDNRQNLYLRVVDLIKLFIRFQEKDFIKYANSTSNFSHVLNKIQNFRLHNPEFQLLFYLIKKNDRKLFRIYIKLRQQILNRCGLNTTKFKSLSLHNQTKNFKHENVELGPIKIDYNYWGMLAQTTRSKISEDMLWWLSQGDRRIPAVQFVKACLWSHEYNSQNPEMDE